MRSAYLNALVLLLSTVVLEAAEPRVEVEEPVTRVEPANNGAGPMWCYGSTTIARDGDEVFVSVIETGKDVPPLCNTRWQLWHRSRDAWKLEQSEKEFRQREPCPIGIFPGRSVFLSVNPSTQPPGTKYGACQPQVLEFPTDSLDASPRVHPPAWSEGTYFTDHSYRGFAADGVTRELLLLNINAQTGDQFVSFADHEGKWHAYGKIHFPIRSCYPQVALRNRTAHVMAIGDIVEPNEEWRKLKFEKLKSNWDYVFRRLFYTCSPDVANKPFGEPIEIDTVEKTAGSISNLDMYVDATGSAHLLYIRRPHQHEFIRDKYFAGEPMTWSLEYRVVRAGKIVGGSTLTSTPAARASGIAPAFARFHVDAREKLWVILAGQPIDKGVGGKFGMFAGRVESLTERPVFIPLRMEHPFNNFFTNTTRGGSKPSDLIDLFGTTDDPPLRYARVRLH